MNDKFYNFFMGAISLLFIAFASMLLIFVGVELFNPPEYNLTNAEPIAQQKIGDDVNPYILIIYEAEVDGEKVYPAVIKESN